MLPLILPVHPSTSTGSGTALASTTATAAATGTTGSGGEDVGSTFTLLRKDTLDFDRSENRALSYKKNVNKATLKFVNVIDSIFVDQ